MLQASFEAVSNREDWLQQCEVRNENNELVDLSDALITLTVRDRQTEQVKLQGSTDDFTINVVGMGIFQFLFPVTDMHNLDASKQYVVGCTILLNSITRQFFVGSVPIIDGIVP